MGGFYRSPIKEKVPAEQMRTYVNKRTGKTHTMPEGIDPGFEWNPGEVRAKALSKALVERRNRFTAPAPCRRSRFGPGMRGTISGCS